MKKVFFVLCLMAGLTTLGHSYVQTIDRIINDVSNAAYTSNALVAISTSTWTQVTPATPFKHRDFIIFNNPSTNSGNFVVVMSTSSTAPTTSINTNIIEVTPSGGALSISLSEDLHLFAVSLATGTENGYIQEFRQR